MSKATFRNLLGFARRYRNFWEVWRNFRAGSTINRIVLWNSWEFAAANTPGAMLLALYNEVWHDDCYRIASADSPFRVREADVVVDIGANIGLFATRAAHLAQRGTVLAVEPDRENFALLTRHVERAGLKNVRTRRAAVSDVVGTATLRRDSFLTHTLAAARMYPEINHAVPTQTVETVTFGALVAELGVPTIDLVKIDAEGAEWDIVKGISDTTWKVIRRMVLEYHDAIRPGTSSYVIEQLTRRGFDVERKPTNEFVGLIFAKRGGPGRQ